MNNRTGSDGAVGTVWEHGAPSGVGPGAAVSVPNCFATDLDDIYTDQANIWLRSPELDLTGVGAARLRFSQFVDVEVTFDRGILSILDAADDSLLAELDGQIDGDLLDWHEVVYNLSAGAGKLIKLEFRFETDDLNASDYAGWYIDDVTVTVP